MKRILIIWALLISVCYAQSKAGFYVVGGKLITVQDTASRKYLKAIENEGVVPSVVQNMASNFLVTSEKAIGSYSLMTAQYPVMGGTANTHRYNLNNPNGLTSGFTLAYFGTITHSANGMQGDGSTGYADTRFNASNLTITNSGLSIYVKSTGFGVDIGANGVNQRFVLHGNSSAGDLNIRSAIGQVSSDVVIPITSFQGFMSGNRSASNRQSLTYNNAISIGTITSTDVMPSLNVFIGGYNLVGSLSLPSPRIYGYAAIHQAFSDTQAIQQSRIVTFYNSLQGR